MTRLLDEESDYCVQRSNIRTDLEFSLDLRNYSYQTKFNKTGEIVHIRTNR